jgi:hypothetical protein
MTHTLYPPAVCPTYPIPHVFSLNCSVHYKLIWRTDETFLKETRLFKDSVVATNDSALYDAAVNLVATGHAAKTIESYTSAWKKWLRFIEGRNIDSTEITETNMCLFSAWLASQEPPLSSATIANYGSGILSYMKILGQPGAKREEWNHYAATLKSLKKRDAPKTTEGKRAALSIAQLLRIKTKCATSEDFNMLTLAGIGIMGLHRLGELAPNKGPGPTLSQLTISETAGSIRLYESKTDIYRNSVIVRYAKASCQSTGFNPVGWLSNLIQSRPTSLRGPESPIFQTKKGCAIRGQSFTKWLRLKLGQIGEHTENVSGHSLRIGGMNELRRLGIDKEVIKAHGRWTSDAVDRYLRIDGDEQDQAVKAMLG